MRRRRGGGAAKRITTFGNIRKSMMAERGPSFTTLDNRPSLYKAVKRKVHEDGESKISVGGVQAPEGWWWQIMGLL